MSATDDRRERPARPAAAAAGSPLAAALAAVACLVLAGGLRRWDVLLVSVVSLASLVVAAWFALSRRGAPEAWRRWSSGVVALVVFVVVVLASESLRVLRRRARPGRARRSARPGSPCATDADAAHDDAPSRRRPGPTHPVLLMNLRSGGGKAERFDLVEPCRAARHRAGRAHARDDLLELAEDAVAARRGRHRHGRRGRLAGTRRLGREPARACRSSWSRPGPATTSPSTWASTARTSSGALDAFEDGVDRVIDLAEVNGRVFVNNASMGVYAKIVQSAEYRDAKVQTAASMLPDLLGPGRDAARPALRPAVRARGRDGPAAPGLQQPLRAGPPAGRRHPGPPRRRRARASSRCWYVAPPDAQKLAALEAAGQVRRFSGWDEWTASEFEVRSAAPVEIGVDGEALTLQPPLRFVIRPGALTVRLPRPALVRPPAAEVVHDQLRDTLAALWRPRWDVRRSQADDRDRRDRPRRTGRGTARRAAEPPHDGPGAGARTGGGPAATSRAGSTAPRTGGGPHDDPGAGRAAAAAVRLRQPLQAMVRGRRCARPGRRATGAAGQR